MLNGHSKCHSSSINETNECSIICNEGYGFATEESNLSIVEDILLLKCNRSISNWFEDSYIPDCSGIWLFFMIINLFIQKLTNILFFVVITESTIPKTVSQEGSIILEGNETNVCDNLTTLREVSINSLLVQLYIWSYKISVFIVI